MRQLADEGLLRRRVATGPGTRVSYALTERGVELRGALVQIHAWAEGAAVPDDAEGAAVPDDAEGAAVPDDGR